MTIIIAQKSKDNQIAYDLGLNTKHIILGQKKSSIGSSQTKDSFWLVLFDEVWGM